MVLFLHALASYSFSCRASLPDRPVKIVMPIAPEGPPDMIARLLIDKMGAALGQR